MRIKFLQKNHLFFLSNAWIARALVLLMAVSLSPTLYAGEKKNPQEIQQRKKVVGVVYDDELNETLPGATVKVVNSTRGVSTDLDGSYEIEVGPDDKLEFSFLGLETQVIPVGNKDRIDVRLKMIDNMLEETTVTAFGKQKKASVVASIEAINPKDLKVPSSNLTTAFAGRMAGLISYQRSGEPGQDNAEFFVRGVTTFGYASSPLILIDGFESTTDELARVEPDNIEQFAILKDATAAALYGSKGANGVIMVTTKSGEEGKPKFSFRHESRFSMPTKIPEMADGLTYMNLYNEARRNDNPNLEPYYSAQKIANTAANLNPYAYPNIDWYDMMFKDYTYNQHYTLNVSGGGKVARYYIAASYDKDTGILKENRRNNFKNNIDIDRFNLVAKTNISLTPTTTVDVNMNSIFESYSGPNPTQIDNLTDATAIFNNVMNANPVEFPAYFEPDEALGYAKQTLFGNTSRATMKNPYAEMVKGYKDGFNNTISSQFVLNQKLDFVTPGLAFEGRAYIKTYGQYESRRNYNPYYYTIKSYDELTDKYVLEEITKGTDALGDPSTTRTATSKLYFQFGFNYAHTFDKHEVGAVAIYTQEENKNTSGGSTIQSTLPQRLQGMRARVNYAYDGKYMAEASVTYNGSEKFDKSHRWGVFPAMGLGYMISNERFWEPIKRVSDKFKLKYSYGMVGNDQIASANERFFFLSDIGTGNNYNFGKDFGTSYGGFSINRYANPEITWETAVKQNVGIETNLFHMADIQVEYFNERRKNIYQARAHLPETMGLTSNVYGNVGEVKSHGVDGSVDINYNISKDAWITGRFNFTFARNEIVENEEPEYKYKYLSKKGYAVNQAWGYVAERLFIDAADVANSPVQNLGSVAQAGDIKYKDINGDGKIDPDDKVAIGYPTTPELNYGFGLSGGYKEWDLSFFFQGQGKSSFFINPNAIAPFQNYRNIMTYIAEDYWSPNNPVAQTFWPRLTTGSNGNNYEKWSTWWLRDGRFLRLKTIELGYTLPKKALDAMKIRTLRVYVTAQNLFCISKFDLWDPEMGDNGLGYPLQRVYSLGVNISF